MDRSRIDSFKLSRWKRDGEFGVQDGPMLSSNQSVHFHASSAGELEILIPLVEEWVRRNSRVRVGITVFSASALGMLERWLGGMRAQGMQIYYSGFSPREDEWEDFLKCYRVTQVIVSRYEAWPGLWAAVSHINLPLILIQAQRRSSFVFAKWFLKICGVELPRLYFYATQLESARELSSLFPHAQVKVGSDPRWVRVATRAALPQSRVSEIESRLSNCKRPLGIVGSAWQEDLDFLLPEWIAHGSGTLLIVPHSLKKNSIAELEKRLDQTQVKNGLSWERASASEGKIESRIVLVDEMGFLLELYRLADWVWVGGGLGRGVHSTLEPAFWGVPIACGRKNSSQFPEVVELIESGQLTICDRVSEFALFLKRLEATHHRARWQKDASVRSQRFLTWVEECILIR